MAGAYTPGLTVSGDIVVRKVRRLPIKGEVLVSVGDEVHPSTTVAQAKLPGILQTIKLTERLGVEARDVPNFFQLKVGDPITKGQKIAETKGFFGLFKSEVTSDFTGTVESISELTGNVLVREPSIPIGITAYITGRIADIMPEEGAVIETRGAMVQGIFGVGGERTGVIRVAVEGPNEVLEPKHILDTDAGRVLIAGSGASPAAIKRAEEVGVTGIVMGGVKDEDLIEYLGYDIGVAITGNEAIPLTLLCTEGFGYLAMAERTFALLRTLEGKEASLNGATQIRAGVIRPEVIVPLPEAERAQEQSSEAFQLTEGTSIRIIREPYFGELASVTALPAQLEVLESGTEVRVLHARLKDGREVVVPRANVEIIAR